MKHKGRRARRQTAEEPPVQPRSAAGLTRVPQKIPAFPFSAIAGQPDLRLALLLASVDWRLSVLLKGDKGSGKSTAARALAAILPAGAPFVNLPVGATEDRLLGGLDLNRALAGEAQLRRGLIHEAHGGVLYIDEVNLLADSLADALLDVASSGVQHVERDGLSASAEAEFILLGSMNAEEGLLRPQLLDRFALSLDVEAPLAAEERARIVELRLGFDADPAVFSAAFEREQQRLRGMIVNARSLVRDVRPSAAILLAISEAVTQAGVRSLRADLGILRAAIAHAALEGRTEVLGEDVAAVLPFVLHHRAKPNRAEPLSPPRQNESAGGGEGSGGERARIFPLEPRQSPELGIRLADSPSRGRSARVESNERRLDVVASFAQSFRNTGSAALAREHLVLRTPHATAGVRFIFVVDASGSHAAQQRMRAVKGVVAALLESSVDRKDEVALVSFRGPKAEVVLPPCRDASEAHRVLEFLPTGGRTPLAHALELTRQLVNPSSVVILVTDGRANVPVAGGDPWAEALEAAAKLDCPGLVVDSSADGADALQTLASAMRATLIRLDELTKEGILHVLP